MVINRFVSIKNVGRFRDYSARGDLEFKKFTLVFAENGRGKTTLCSVLRSLGTANPGIILGRKTLGEVAGPEVHVRIDGRDVRFRGDSWNGVAANFSIFDSVYVSANVHSGDAVDVEHRRNLYRIIIGEQGVALAKRVEDLDSAIRIKSGDIRAAQAAVNAHVPRGWLVTKFLELPDDEDFDSKIESAERNLAAGRQSDQLSRRPALKTITLPEWPILTSILDRGLEGVSADAEQKIRAQISAHSMHYRGERWLSEGLAYQPDETCPFCGQDTGGLDLISAYRSFFGEAYAGLKAEIDAFHSDVSAHFGITASAEIARIISNNQTEIEIWRPYLDLAEGSLPEPFEVKATFDQAHKEITGCIERKKASPLESIQPSDGIAEAQEQFRQTATLIEQYNQKVVVLNAMLSEKKAALSSADITALEDNLIHAQTTKLRHSDTTKADCDRLQLLNAEKVRLEDEKANARSALDTHTLQLLGTYQNRINYYLDRFNAGFEIVETAHAYTGGVPSSTYRIMINRTPVDLGRPDSPDHQTSFRNTLSNGDRSTLALAFFLAQLDQDPNKAERVVVFDDPFNSQDQFRRTCTIHQIIRLASEVAQVVVLSHDPHFLKSLWDEAAPDSRKSLALMRVGQDNTNIVEWDIDQAVQARYQQDISVLQRFYNNAGGNPRDVVQKLRPILEAYCRMIYPIGFDANEMLGGIIGKINTVGARHPLWAIVAELDEINRYTRRYMHGENPLAATEPIPEQELLGFVKRTLQCVGYMV